LTLLANVVCPLAATCAAALTQRSITTRRWPCYTVTALLTFVATSACLAYECHVMGLYGLEIGRVWWTPWR
jgi:hypothetical protein